MNVGFAVGAALGRSSRDVAIPPATPQTSPVPTHAMHLSMPRRSIPSSLGDSCWRRCGFVFVSHFSVLGLKVGMARVDCSQLASQHSYRPRRRNIPSQKESDRGNKLAAPAVGYVWWNRRMTWTPAEKRSADLEPDERRQFEQATLPHLDAAYNLARWLTQDEHAAEDVVQEAFLARCAVSSAASGAAMGGRGSWAWFAGRRSTGWPSTSGEGPWPSTKTFTTGATNRPNPEYLAIRKSTRQRSRRRWRNCLRNCAR